LNADTCSSSLDFDLCRTYLVLALGRLPGFRVGRTGAAIIGATLMVAVNALTLPEAVEAINTDTILLLFGMMIVVANSPD